MLIRMGLGATLLTTLLATAPAAQDPPAAASQQAPPTFRSGIDLVTIEATVVDRDGQHVPGLGAADFEVLVDGRPRRLVTVQYFDVRNAVRPAPPATGTGFSTNESDTADLPPERLIVLAVDHSGFTPLGAHPAIEAARRFLANLDPTDRVAFASFPAPDVFVPPTIDRGPIEQALGRIVGTADPAGGISRLRVGLSEAVDIANGDSFAYNKAFDRECRIGTPSPIELKACADELSMIVQQTVLMVQMRAARSLQSLAGLVESFKAVEGRKTLVLVSAGLFSSNGPGVENNTPAIRALGEAAATANMGVHVLHVDTALTDAFGADRQGVLPSVGLDRMLLAAGLEDIAGASGGALARVPTGADAAFDRIARELAAYYALAIETDPEDRDGRPHRVTVKTRRPGTEVRSRQRFTVDAAPAGASPDERIASILRSGKTVRDLPVRVATGNVKDKASDAVRVIVRADVGRGVAGPAELRVGLAFYDTKGDLARSSIDTQRVSPAAESDASWPFAGAVVLPPGPYTLRAVVMDPEGRIGSVTHRFEATLPAGEGARFSDLLIFDPARGGASAPIVDGHVRGGRMVAYLEVYPEATAPVDRVEFAVESGPDAAPIFREPGRVTRPEDGRAQAEAEFDLALLPPGEYGVSATAFAGGKTLGRSVRAVTVDRADAVRPGALAGVRVPRIRFTPGESGALGRRFVRDDVLRADALAYFLSRLRAADAASGAGPVAEAMAAVDRGEFESAGALLERADASQLAVPFLKGLVLFKRGDLNLAAAEFRAAVEIASDFLPAAFYLGACFAAGNQDEHAIGAWQTTLISEDGSRVVYDLLADAYLRLRNGQQALATLQEARERWPDDDLFLPRMAVAQSLSGEPRAALDTLEDYLSRHGSDADTLFLGVRLLYDAHAAGTSIRSAAEDAELAARLGEQYRAASGPNVALVDRWVAYIRQSAERKR